MPVIKSPSHLEIPALFRIKKQQSTSSVLDKISIHRRKHYYGSLFNTLSSIREENESSLFKLRLNGKKYSTPASAIRSQSPLVPLPPPPPAEQESCEELMDFESSANDELPPPPKIQVLKIVKANKFQPPPPKLAPIKIEIFKRSSENLISYKKDDVKVIRLESFTDSSTSTSQSSSSVSLESLIHKSPKEQQKQLKTSKHVNFMPHKMLKTNHIYSSLQDISKQTSYSMQPPLPKFQYGHGNSGLYKSLLNINLNNNRQMHSQHNTNVDLRGKRGGFIYSSLNNVQLNQSASLTRSPNVTLNKFKGPTNIHQPPTKRQQSTSMHVDQTQPNKKRSIQIDIKTNCINEPSKYFDANTTTTTTTKAPATHPSNRQSINITTNKHGSPIKYIGVSIGSGSVDTLKSCQMRTGVLIKTTNHKKTILQQQQAQMQANKSVHIKFKDDIKSEPKKSILKNSTSIKMNANLNKENLKPKTTKTLTNTNSNSTQFKSTTKIQSDFSKLMHIDLEQELKSFHSLSSKTTPNSSYNYISTPTSSISSLSSTNGSSYESKFMRPNNTNTSISKSETTSKPKRRGLIITNLTKFADYTNRTP